MGRYTKLPKLNGSMDFCYPLCTQLPNMGHRFKVVMGSVHLRGQQLPININDNKVSILAQLFV